MAIKKMNQQGFSFVELLIAVGILAVLASGVALSRKYMSTQTQKTSDKIFATQKAIQMFEELRAIANQGGQSGLLTLDNYSDGSNYNDILTTDKNVTSPSDSLSKNINVGYWKFWRQVEVLHVAQDTYARIVNVKVYGGLSNNAADTGNLLASVGGILRTNNSLVSPSQVYDVYELAISNELGWFTSVPLMDTAFTQAVSAVETLNPGLVIRDHHITQSAFGRDYFYTPYINSNVNPTTGAAVANNDTTEAVMPWVYFYPGYTPEDTVSPDTGADEMFFSPTELEAVGGINVNGTNLNDNGYSMADMYNTAMRYPDELAAYNAVSQFSTSTYEMTLRMLLDKMNSEPASMMNPLIINMHGEVLPLVNMRNYSDPAKDPLNASGCGGPNMRVVTHPTLIHYKSTMPVTLRVYGYYDGLLNPSNLDTTYPVSPSTLNTSTSNVATTITLYFPSLKLTTSDIGVNAIIGGISNGVTYKYQSELLANGSAASQMNMWWNLGNPNGTDTAITLFNTPLRCMAVSTAGPVTTGLLSTYRLYNTEYIPCSVNTNISYATDLTTSETVPGPVNTARWVIAINKVSGATIPDGQYAVETRIGASTITGDYNYNISPTAPVTNGSTGAVTANELMSDLSRTYVWIGTGSNSSVTWGGSGVTPFTERYQYNGDPRDCPYLDCKFGNSATGTNTADSGTAIDSDSYNWFFRPIGINSDGYSGFAKTYGTGTGPIGQSYGGYDGHPSGTGSFGDLRDMPRYYYTYRRGIMQTTGIYTNINGRPSFHAAEGGEFGGLYAPYSNSLQFISTPWDPTHTAAVESIDEIQYSSNWGPGTQNTNAAARVVMYNNNESYDVSQNWVAKYWLGELYPDVGSGVTYAATWMSTGNLPTVQFWRVPFSSTVISGSGNADNNGFDTANGRLIQWGIGNRGGAALLNGSSVNTTSSYGFYANSVTCTASITSLGLNLYNLTNFSLSSPISVKMRPWNCFDNLSIDTSYYPNEWSSGDAYYKNLRTFISVPTVSSSGLNRLFYTSDQTNSNVDTAASSDGNTLNLLGVIEADNTTPSPTSAGYFNISGLAPEGDTGTQLLSEMGIDTMLRTFIDAGLMHAAGTTGHIPQLPLFQVSTGNPANQFNNPSAVTLSWSSPVSWPTSIPVTQTLWTRWAGFASGANWYSEEYPGYVAGSSVTNSTYVEPVTMFYVPMYSPDATHWISCIDDATTMTLGNYFAPASLATTQMAVTWNVSNGSGQFPQNLYSVRVDGFRQGYPLHYSYHEVQDISFTR